MPPFCFMGKAVLRQCTKVHSCKAKKAPQANALFPCTEIFV